MIWILQHLNEFWPGLILCLVVGLVMMEMPWAKSHVERFAKSRLDRFVLGLFIGAACFVGWTKGPVSIGRHVAQFVTALNDGSIIDVSGLIATSSEEETLAAFADLSVAIANAASQTVVNAGNEFAAVAGLVTNEERRVIYVQSSLPRTDPSQGLLNHNISAFVVRTSMSTNQAVVSRYVWYSSEPLVGPTVACTVDVGGGAVKLTSITNTFPDTIEISGIDCVRYDYSVPPELRNVVFFPDTEFTFGSDDQYLMLSPAGVSVDIEDNTHLPFSGTDSYFAGRVEVQYKGGIATACWIDGAAVTNGVYEL